MGAMHRTCLPRSSSTGHGMQSLAWTSASSAVVQRARCAPGWSRTEGRVWKEIGMHAFLRPYRGGMIGSGSAFARCWLEMWVGAPPWRNRNLVLDCTPATARRAHWLCL